MLRQWMGTARYVYNQTVALLEKAGTTANWFAIKTGILDSLPEWSKPVPYQIKSIAIKEACIAVANAKKKCKLSGQYQKVKFRSKKNRRGSIFIPKSAVIGQTVYPRLLGLLKTFGEQIPKAAKDCWLVYQYGKYFLCVPMICPRIQSENQRGLVALDPGVRTFQTFFAGTQAGKFGHGDFSRIARLCYALDKLIGKMSKSNAGQRQRMRKACDRIRFKIHNLVDEIHHKAALWLCRNYDTIALPTFETSHMVTKLRSKTARAMLTWAHFRFKSFIKFKAYELYAQVLDMNESYTSKTCTRCGKITNIGSKKIFSCPSCGLIMDRDIHGARNIYLRALVDTPSII